VRAVGPAITAQDASIVSEYAAMGMERLRPRFSRYVDGTKVLRPVKKIADPETFEPGDPDTISLMFEIPPVEEDVSFTDFVRGVVMVSSMLEPGQLDPIKESCTAVAQRIINSGSLPTIDEDFAEAMHAHEVDIFTNGEATSWRSLMAYAYGAYWLLSFVASPSKRRGRFSPMDVVSFLVTKAAQLGYVPR